MKRGDAITSIFDKFKKKEQVINLHEMELLVVGASVRFYVTRILKDNDRSSGFIYLNDLPIPFSYGNLGEIIDPAYYDYEVLKLYRAEVDGKLYFKLAF